MSSSEDDAAFDAFLASLKPPKKNKYRVSSGSLNGFVVDDSYVSFEDSSLEENGEERKCNKKKKFHERKGIELHKSYIDETDDTSLSADSNDIRQRNEHLLQSTNCDISYGDGKINSTIKKIGLIDYDDIGNGIKSPDPNHGEEASSCKEPLSRRLVLSSIKGNRRNFTPKRSTANTNSVSSKGTFLTPRVIFSSDSDSDEDSPEDISNRSLSIEDYPEGNAYPIMQVPAQEFDKISKDQDNKDSNRKKIEQHYDDSIESLFSDFDQVELDRQKSLTVTYSDFTSKTDTSTDSPFTSTRKKSKILIFSDDSESDDDVMYVESDSDKENATSNSSNHGSSWSDFGSDNVFLTPIHVRKKTPLKPTLTKSVSSILNGDCLSEADKGNNFLPPTVIRKKTPIKPIHTPLQSTRTPYYKTPASTRENASVKKDGLPPNLPRNCENGTGFKRHRDVLTKSLYEHFNKTVFDDKLPKDLIVEWDKRLLKTAGVTKCSTRTTTTSNYGISCIDKVYSARICLSDKVLDTLHRLRDTLCHEMCHAAVWLIDKQNDGHGPFWKRWARKATIAHPDMPVVKRCHSYDISYKFHYQCTMCRKVYGRHSKSIKVDKQVCGICKGRLVLLPPKKLDGTPIKARTPNKFAMFVKDNYKTTQKSHSVGGVTPKHSDVMKALSTQFASLSARK